ncbi:MAG: aminopeptidase P N-terminal domain-containing protein [Bacteroidales bacterium]|nr:aminopeptidase P N-terminal domain-containing protein [Bacteroidales bacterium]
MKYMPLSAEFYRGNRVRVSHEIASNSLVIVTSSDEYPSRGDMTHPFKQNANLLYLCGIDQEDTTLALMPWHPDKGRREVLFVKNPSPEMITWYGHRLSKAEASRISGIETVIFNEQKEDVLHEMMMYAENVYLHLPEYPRLKMTFPTSEVRFAKKLKEQYPLHAYKRLAPILYPMRSVKAPEELATLKHACEITGHAFARAARAVKPGKYEYEIEAELTYEMLRRGASGHAFAPIVAAGADTCILHYITNNKRMQDGDLLLLDFGAEYANYAGDCSRTLPVNGHFTPRQKAVYEAVLTIYKETIPRFVPGMTIHKINDFVFKRMEEEMIKLGLFTREDVQKQDKSKPLFKQYYMHNTSHFIGLDVHDVGERDWLFQPGQVLSCEPGIYIARENIGVRIETDVVVADNPIDLMKNVPVEIEDIETLMRS